MTRAELQARTKRFAIEVIRLCASLPPRPELRVIGHQLIRCATSIGANYRAVCRSRSARDFIAKIGVVEEEADEAQYWLELLKELHVDRLEESSRLHREASELLAIFVASRKTAKSRHAKP